jgi:hypothetical protein
MNRFFLALLFAVSAQAFMMPSAGRIAPRPLNIMTQEEAEKILTHATDCIDSECGLDEVDDLIVALKDQQSELNKRVEEIRGLIKSLETVHTSDKREVDEVRETVRAIFRIFQMGDKASGNDYPSLSKPTGYSGEVGSGPKTAYDALPPKKWKNPSP